MVFKTEPTCYEKTILSDLQGAWSVLRSTVAENAGFPSWDKMIFHIDEAMSWESVRERRLDRMRSTLVLVRNLAVQSSVTQEIMESIDEVSDILNEVLKEIDSGKIK